MFKRSTYQFTLFLLALHTCCLLKTEAQSMREFYQNPDMLPKSPDVSNLFRFSEVPVDQSSGTANINIPIYTIQQGKIEIPISLGYNTSGVKVREVASMIGLGWGLSFGGSISVTEQDYSGNYCFRRTEVETSSQAITNWSQVHEYLWLMANGYAQTEQPMYNFSFNGYQGKFFYDINNQPHIAPQYQGIQIERIPADMNLNPTGFKITTPEGIQYLFSSVEMGYTESSLQKPTAFYITKIVDLNNEFDQVDFTYSIKPQITTPTRSTHLFETFEPQPRGGSGNVPFFNAAIVSTKNQYTNELSIQSIQFKKGKIVFTTTDDRLDQGKRRIRKIELQNESNIKIKEWNFNQSYFLGNGSNNEFNYRLRLDDVTVTAGQSSEKYAFEYDATTLPPTNSLAEDYWGFYNGKVNNTGQISWDVATHYGVTYGWQNYSDRNADSNYTKCGILKKIIYPTGGSMALVYENHTSPGFALGAYLGGLRVKNISYFDPVTSTTTQKNYIYSSGYSLTNLTYSSFYYEKKKMASEYTLNGWNLEEYNTKNINSEPLAAIAYHNGSPVFYNEVEEYYGSPSGQNGKTIYKFNYIAPLYVFVPFKDYGYQYLIDNAWERGQVNSVEYYNYNSVINTYNLVKKEAYYYEDAVVETVYIGLHVIKNHNKCGMVWGGCGSADDVVTDYQTYWDTYSVGNYGRYLYFDAYTYTGRKKMVKKEETNYSTGISLMTTTNYNYLLYNSHYLFLRSLSGISSKGDVTSTEYKYPFDFASSSAESAAMVSKNMISVPTEQKMYLNNVLKTTFKKNYSFWNNNTLLEISNIQSATNANPLEIETAFTSYSISGRPLQLTAKDGIKKVYLLGYNDNYYTAEAINVDSPIDIAYTSFEGTYQTLQGNWQLTGTAPIADATCPTGTTCYWIGGSNTINKYGLITSTTYIVSYWSKNGPYTVTGSISSSIGKTLNGWTNYKHTVTNVSSTSIQSSVYGFIDEVRLYPEKAFMTTYTYSSLGGISTQCNANDLITRYEYDGLGRLVLVRDQDGNVLKKICYNYAGQPENCLSPCTNFTPNWQNTSTPPTCQQNSCGNTGYQLQEQRDMNPCSPTYNQTQIITVYNPTACPLPNNVSLTYQNSVNIAGFTASYYNQSTTQTYNFTIPANGSGILGCLPVGIYNLTISKTGNNAFIFFDVGCRSTSGTSAFFKGISVNSGSCDFVHLDFAY